MIFYLLCDWLSGNILTFFLSGPWTLIIHENKNFLHTTHIQRNLRDVDGNAHFLVAKTWRQRDKLPSRQSIVNSKLLIYLIKFKLKKIHQDSVLWSYTHPTRIFKRQIRHSLVYFKSKKDVFEGKLNSTVNI